MDDGFALAESHKEFRGDTFNNCTDGKILEIYFLDSKSQSKSNKGNKFKILKKYTVYNFLIILLF